MALMANTGGITMTAFTLDTLETNIIESTGGDFLGQTLAAGTYVMLFDPNGSKFGLMQANTSGGSIVFDENAPYFDVTGTGFELAQLHTAISNAAFTLGDNDSYAIPPNIFNFSASTTFQTVDLNGDYAALPNFEAGSPNFQLVPITITDLGNGNFDIDADTTSGRDPLGISQAELADSNSAFNNLSNLTVGTASYVPSDDSGSGGSHTHLDVEHVFTVGSYDSLETVTFLLETSTTTNGTTTTTYEKDGFLSNGLEIKVYDRDTDALITDIDDDGVYKVGTAQDVTDGTHEFDGAENNNLEVKVIDTNDSDNVVATDGAYVGPHVSPIKIEVHREYDANNNFLGLSVGDYKDLTVSADALVADASNFSLSQGEVDAFGVNGTNLVVKAGTDDGSSFTQVAVIGDSDGNGIYSPSEIGAGNTHVLFELQDAINNSVIAGSMEPVAESTSGSGSGNSTATGSIKSIVKSGAARLDVQFDQNLVKDNANLEAGDFSIAGAGGITVTSAEYTTGAPDKVSLVLSAALPNTGTLNVSYDGASHGTGALQFVGATTTIPAGNPSESASLGGFKTGGISTFEIIPGQPGGTAPPHKILDVGGSNFTVTEVSGQLVAHVDGGSSIPLFQNDGTTALSAGDLVTLTTATAFVAGGDDLSTHVAGNSLTPDTTINVSAPPAVDAAVRLKFTTGVTDASGSNSDPYEADDFFVGLVDHNTGEVTYATATNVENDPNEGGDLIIEAPGIDDNVVSVAYDMTEGTSTDNAIKVGGVTTETAEIVLSVNDGDIKSVSTIQDDGINKTIDVQFSRDIDDTGSTLDPSDFGYFIDTTLPGLTAQADAQAYTPTSVALHSTDSDTVTLTIDGAHSVESYVAVGYSDSAAGNLQLVSGQATGAPTTASNGSGSIDLSTATVVAPAAVTEFNVNNIAADVSDAGEDNVFNMATGKVDAGDAIGAAGDNDDYTAFGGDGDDSADSISGGDVFVGGDGNDTANLTGSFQDYTFTDIGPGDTLYDTTVTLGVDDFAQEAELTGAEAAALESDLIPTGSDGGGAVAVNVDPEAPVAAEYTTWAVQSDDSSVMDGTAVIQAENIFFEGGPVVEINDSISTTPLAEKENLASDFGTHTVTVDVSDSGFTGAQTMFWQIDTSGVDSSGQDYTASANDFVHTTGYVDIAAGASDATFDIMIVNDGDEDEAEETFGIKVGYVIGDNKAEQVLIGIDDGTGGFEGSHVVIDLTENDTAFPSDLTAAGTLTVSGVDPITVTADAGTTTTPNQEIESILIGDVTDILAAGKELKVNVQDSADNIFNIGHNILSEAAGVVTAEITSSDLAYAASSENFFLEQHSIDASIAADPMEWYVWSGWQGADKSTNLTFNGEDFLGASIDKTINGNEANTYSSIQSAIDDAKVKSMTNLEIRVANDHTEAYDVNVTVDNLKIDFWDTGTAANTDAICFKLFDSDTDADDILNLTLGGERDAKIIGNNSNNKIIGNDGNNKIYGKSGDDQLLGKGGNDLIYAGRGDDFADGGAGSDRVYGNSGNDNLQATSDAYNLPAADDTAELTSKDLLSGGSGNDVLIDMANKSTGEVVALGGSGQDIIRITSDRNSMDFEGKTPLPFDPQNSVDRQVNSKVADLSHADAIDTSFLALEATAITAVAATAGAGARDGLTASTLFLETDLAGSSSVSIASEITAFGTDPATSRLDPTTQDAMTIDLSKPIGTEVIYTVGLQIEDDKGNADPADDVVIAATPVQNTTGSISLSHVDASHITSSDTNMAAGGALEAANNHQTIFDLVAGSLNGTEDQVIFLPTG